MAEWYSTMRPGSLKRVVQTSGACPSQWDAWTVTGHKLYLRFRFGHGEVRDWNTDTVLCTFHYGDEWLGVISLQDFCKQAGLTLAEDYTYDELYPDDGQDPSNDEPDEGRWHNVAGYRWYGSEGYNPPWGTRER